MSDSENENDDDDFVETKKMHPSSIKLHPLFLSKSESPLGTTTTTSSKMKAPKQ